MKAKNKKTNHLERVLVVAGLALIVTGCIANIYGASTNIRFIHEPIDSIYYFRYLVLLGGGFAAGYLLAQKSALYARLFIGIAYAVLAVALFWLFDFARVGLQSAFGMPPHPLGKIVFMGAPLLFVGIALVVAYVSQYKANRESVSPFTKGAILASFIMYQVGTLASELRYFVVDTATYDPTTPWLALGSYLLSPLAVAIVLYAFLSTIKQFDRLFYAALTGMLYSTFIFVLWEFHIDPSSEATNSFSSVATTISIVYAGILIWYARKAIKK